MTTGRSAYLLDGDNLRHGLTGDLGFSPEDRAENVRRVAHAARLLADVGSVALVSLVSPYRSDRQMAREIVSADGIPFVEIYVSTPLAVCEGRDPKGLYAKARRGEIDEFTGVSAPYEAPEQAGPGDRRERDGVRVRRRRGARGARPPHGEELSVDPMIIVFGLGRRHPHRADRRRRRLADDAAAADRRRLQPVRRDRHRPRLRRDHQDARRLAPPARRQRRPAAVAVAGLRLRARLDPRASSRSTSWRRATATTSSPRCSPRWPSRWRWPRARRCTGRCSGPGLAAKERDSRGAAAPGQPGRRRSASAWCSASSSASPRSARAR